MEADVGGFLLVKEEAIHGILDIGAQFIPPIGLSENALSEALRHESAILFLCHFKNYLTHETSILLPVSSAQQRFPICSGKWLGGSAIKPLTFEDGTTQTVIGDLWISRATLRSTSPGSAWYLTLDLTTGTQSLIERVDVQDSDASGGQTIDAGVGSVDSDRNVNWQFPPPGTVVLIR